MIIICSNCNTKYSINKRVLGKNGKKVKCSNCEHKWYQKIDIIKKKGVEVISLKEQQIEKNFVNEEIDDTKVFSSETIKKKSNSFLYLFILAILILFIYLNEQYFNYPIKDYFFNLIKKEFLINNKNKNSFNLVLNQIEKEVNILHNNQRIIKVFGKISNTSNTEDYKIPKLQATLLDNNENIITSWFFYAEQENLEPQGSIDFNTSYIHDNQNIADIKIEFYKKVE